MNDLRKSLRAKLKKSLAPREPGSPPPPLCFIGFDGFTDEILSVVDTRSDEKSFQPLLTIAELGQRIHAAAGKSTNIELVLKRKKIGGNAPNITQALLESGHRIIFAGAIGEANAVEPLFQSMAARCEKVFCLCPSAHSDALEFQDGKIILGKLEILQRLDYELLLKHVSKEELVRILEESFLFVSANWTMLLHMSEIWKKIGEEILPALSLKPRYFFIDLADPAKRSYEDLRQAVTLLRQFSSRFEVILGLNEAEAYQLAEAFEIPFSDIGEVAKNLQAKTQLAQILIHPTRYAVCATSTKLHHVEGFYCEHPLLLTGAGDNFNAGYCNGLLRGFSLQESLLCGVATSGYYVKYGKSPTLLELFHFLESAPQSGG